MDSRDKNIFPYLYLLQIERIIFMTKSAAMNHVTPLSDSENGVQNCNKIVPKRGLKKSNHSALG